MRRFESVVMSETEPVTPGTLWLRPKKNTLDKSGPTQFDIWYFSESGWRPIADYDTRYNFKPSYDKAPSGNSIIITPDANPEVGIVNNDLNFKIFDGSREMQSSSNFVLESGLKKEIDDLRAYVEGEVSRLDTRIDTLSNAINNLSNQVSSNTDRIAMVEGKLALLEP